MIENRWILVGYSRLRILKFIIVLISLFFSFAILAKVDEKKTKELLSPEGVSIDSSGPWLDKNRPEIMMKLLGYSTPAPATYTLPKYRSITLQIYKPSKKELSKGKALPVILFSSGWGEDFRLYSAVLKNICDRGYFIVNIDHYFYQNTQKHPPGYDAWVKRVRKSIESLSNSKQEEQFMKTKYAALKVYTEDITFVMNRLSDILKNEPLADLKNIVLMGHSLGGNADKKVIEEQSNSDFVKMNVKAFVSFDSRLNQLGLKTNFEVPTLLLGAYSWYQKPDPLRQLPPQPNLKLKVLDHTTHVSFDDFAIFSVLGQDLNQLKTGMNSFARDELETDIRNFKNGKLERFGDRLFLGSQEEMIQFVSNLSETVDEFLARLMK